MKRYCRRKGFMRSFWARQSGGFLNIGGSRMNAWQPDRRFPPRERRRRRKGWGHFLRWCLSGSLADAVAGDRALFGAGGRDGGREQPLFLGMVIDTAHRQRAGAILLSFKCCRALLMALGFFLFVRPVLFGLSAASNAIIVQPNVNPLVLSRLNRWTLGQSVRFFDDDFAGRIAQKQMQTAHGSHDRGHH